MLALPLNFFDLLDDAFKHTQGVFPHDVLELRRQQLRSWMWEVVGTNPKRRISQGVMR